MRKNENGFIVVETITSFILFVFVMVSILSLVNIVVLQARVHYALTQAANTLSMYSYSLEVTGVADKLKNISSNAGKARAEAEAFKVDLQGVIDGMESLSVEVVDAVKSGEDILIRTVDATERIIEDPMRAISLLINFGMDTAKDAIFQRLARPLIGRYLSNGDMTGDEYLRSVNVINGLEGIEFKGSHFIDAKGDIILSVEYEVEYKFGALPLPFDRLRITQAVKTKAWLGGSGEGYVRTS